MGFRFRKSVRLAPGVRLNFSTRGMSLSAGPRGASVSVGSRGVYANVGIPGTGISYRTRLDGAGPSAPRQALSAPVPGEAILALQDDGTVEIRDPEGNPLPPRLARLARENNAGRIQAWLEEQCEHWNRGIEEILGLHLRTPPPSRRVVFVPESFSVPAPQPTPLRPYGILGRLFRSRRERIDRENEEHAAAFRSLTSAWESRARSHAATQNAIQHRIEVGRLTDPEVMQEFLSEALGRIEWPRETNLSFEIRDGGGTALLDVDLPEIEDIPTEEATPAARGLRIIVKQRSDTRRRKEYATHVHAVTFRVIGETFVTLPTVREVVCSGFSQRVDRATGRVRDEYLLSVRVSRADWERVDFANLPAIDLPACLAAFDLRREMTSTGIFRPIEPFDGTP